MDEEKRKFLNNEILSSSIFAGLARGHVYNKQEVNENDKKNFKNTLKCKLDEHSKSYKTKIKDVEHVENIKQFSDGMSIKFGKILEGNRFRIGTAQKILNLYLKYLWVLGWIPEPPHCPFDSIVINKLELDPEIKFTKFDSIKDYRKLVTVASQKAKDEKLSIAQWELKFWNQKIIKINSQKPLDFRNPNKRLNR